MRSQREGFSGTSNIILRPIVPVTMFYPTLLSCLLALCIGVSAYSNPEPCSGDCFAQDPGLIRRSSDGLYFRFNTDTYIDIMTSKSLSGPWTTAGSVLPDGSLINISDSQALWVSQLPSININQSLFKGTVLISGSISVFVSLCV